MILKYSGVTGSMLDYADSQLFEIQRPEESTQPSVMFGTEYESSRPVEWVGNPERRKLNLPQRVSMNQINKPRNQVTSLSSTKYFERRQR